jgi:hypothetical protein
MSSSGHELYRRWLRELWHGDYRAADELIDEQFVGHWPDTDVHGKDDLLAMIDQTRSMMTGLRFELTIEPFGERDLVGARWAGRGETNDGPVTFAGNDILRIRAGKIVEYWVGTVSSTPRAHEFG